MKHARTARPAPRGRCLVMAVAAIAALRCASTTTLADEPAATHSGKISAELLDASTGLEAFRGIPFAAPPTGTLRWRPPQDEGPMDGSPGVHRVRRRLPTTARIDGVGGRPPSTTK